MNPVCGFEVARVTWDLMVGPGHRSLRLAPGIAFRGRYPSSKTLLMTRSCLFLESTVLLTLPKGCCPSHWQALTALCLDRAGRITTCWGYSSKTAQEAMVKIT